MDPRARRSVCLLLFLLLGAAPVLFVGWWCRGRHQPRQAQDEAAWLSASLGMRVTVTAFEHTVPGTIRYRDVALCHPESSRCLARIPRLECSWRTGDDQQRRSVLLLEAESLEVDADELEELYRLARHLLQSRVDLAGPCRLQVQRVELYAGRQTHTLHRAWAALNPLTEGMEIQSAWATNPQAESQEPVLGIRIARNRQASPPETGFEFTTGGTWVPVRLLARAIPALARLGTDAGMSGRLWAKQSAEGWQGEFSGQIKDIDLRSVLDPRLPLRLEGTAQANVQTARFNQSRLSELAAALTAGPGTASRAFLSTAAQHLQIAVAADWSRTGELIPYSQLAVAVFLDEKGLRLLGQLPGSPGGVLLDNQRQPILGAASPQALPASALIHALAPPAALSVPASPQALELADLLPLGEAEAPAALIGQRPQSPPNLRQ